MIQEIDRILEKVRSREIRTIEARALILTLIDTDSMLASARVDDLKTWVKDENPDKEGYYVVLTGNSDPNYIWTCRAAVHFWYADKKEWSSETTYWLKDIK